MSAIDIEEAYPTYVIELAEAKANAGRLLAALKQLIPTNICLSNPNLPDSTVVPCDVTLGELRAASAAIAKAEARQ